jgi:glyoxylase-like metal-dependent hydrolase (beta-lactamase superfamily II)
MNRFAAFLGASAMALASPATAQDMSAVEIKAEIVRPGIAVLFGQGGNIAVSYGSDGTVMIDDQFAPLTAKIEVAVAALGASPVKYLINTHWHGDHTGGNENFGKAGAVILAHDHVRDRMATPQERPGGRIIGPAPAIALPVITWHDGASVHANGDEIHMMHVKHAHTDGDSIVFWKQANVVHMGDTFFNKVTLPFIDLNSGGSAKGLLVAIDTVLKKVDDKTVIIPGHGPVATKADLAAYRDMLASVIGAVEAGIAKGQSLDAIKAAKPAAKWDTNPAGFIGGDAFVETVHKSLTSASPHDHAKHSEHGEAGGHDHGSGDHKH